MIQNSTKTQGFTLTELMVVVAILGIISAVGIPIYTDYVDTARVTSAQSGLQAIYVKQQEYYTDNNAYYSTGACADSTNTINTNLFDSKQVLDGTYFYYCITQAGSDDFTAQAVEQGGGGRTYTIDEDNNTNF